MSTTLIVTDVGAAAENTAIAGGSPLSPINSIVLSDGTPPANADDYKLLTALGNEVYRTSVLAIEHLSSTVMKLTGSTPPDQEFRIREIGIELADGTLFGYTPYMLANDGYWKGTGLAWSFEVYFSREQGNSTLTVNYSPLDISAIRDQLVSDTTAAMDLYLQADQINYVNALSGLARTAYAQELRINSMEAAA
jgi:hypothetical protein